MPGWLELPSSQDSWFPKEERKTEPDHRPESSEDGDKVCVVSASQTLTPYGEHPFQHSRVCPCPQLHFPAPVCTPPWRDATVLPERGIRVEWGLVNLSNTRPSIFSYVAAWKQDHSRRHVSMATGPARQEGQVPGRGHLGDIWEGIRTTSIPPSIPIQVSRVKPVEAPVNILTEWLSIFTKIILKSVELAHQVTATFYIYLYETPYNMKNHIRSKL